MNKQIIYPKLIPRLFAANVDLCLLLLIINLLVVLVPHDNFTRLEPLTNFLLQITALSLYFLGFWMFAGASPGAMLMHMKIVDAKTLQAPGRWRLCIRFLALILSPIGIWFVIFTNQKQALHDKIAGTLVIKT